MEQKREIKISLKFFIIICIVCLLFIGTVIFFYNRNSKYYKVTIRLSNSIFDEATKNLENILINTEIITNYNEYNQILEAGKKCKKISILHKIPNDIFLSNNIAVVHCSRTDGNYYTKVLSTKERDNTLIAHMYSSDNTLLAKTFYDIYFIPVSKNITDIEYNVNIPDRKFRDDFYAEKPIIYLYPQTEEAVEIKLGFPNKIITSYPKYTNNWKVIAKPNGDLKDINTNRQLYSLYYENENTTNFKVGNEGFIIKGENSAEFLEEKLAILGLTERESEEFIVYWLPKLEANKYNYIRFATSDEINENMPLEINPSPDTVIRVLMTFKGLDNPIKVKEQQLTTPERNGFVAVEWGGTKIN